MIGLPPMACPPDAVQKLNDEQRDIDDEPTFADRAALAKARWEGRTDNRAFDAVRETLGKSRPGGFFCHYCENNTTSAVEHIWPKSLYPERAFVWENYLLACFRCNTECKRDQWAFVEPGGNLTHATAPPQSGDTAFIDPRSEDPLPLIRLDFADWKLKPHDHLPARDKARVTYTVDEVLDLNDEAFRRARLTAFESYCHQLGEYRKSRDAALAQANFQARLHPTVWQEMKRMHLHPKIAPYFDGIPEVLAW